MLTVQNFALPSQGRGMEEMKTKEKERFEVLRGR